MTGHREQGRDDAFREFRESLAPLEASGKMRGVLLQYHPRVEEIAGGAGRAGDASRPAPSARATRRVPPPLVGDRGGAAGDARLPRAARPRVRLRRLAADASDERRADDLRRHAPGRLRPLPRPELADLEHP